MGIQPLILRLQPYSLTWRNTNIQPHRTIFWWDKPQLTSVTELSEQKLPLVTPPTCTVISALSLRKKTLPAGVTVSQCRLSKGSSTLAFSSMCFYRMSGSQQTAGTGHGANICEGGQDRQRGWSTYYRYYYLGQADTTMEYRLHLHGDTMSHHMSQCHTMWHVCCVLTVRINDIWRAD